jgi:putative serine protease PepD
VTDGGETDPHRQYVHTRHRSILLVLTLAGAAGACSSDTKSSPASSSGTVGCDAVAVASKVLPSVVTITAGNSAGSVIGSGEVLRDDGYILTNNHVVNSAANGGTIQVISSNGTSAPATITGRDPLTDLAVIKIDVGAKLTPIALASSAAVQIGQPVVVLGAPLGLASTVTTGIVSALGRTVIVDAGNGETAVLLSALQTDAAINPGNSGGSMVDCAGRLVGVPSATASVPDPSGGGSVGNVGLGFAIPVDLAKAVADELIAAGAITHSYLGLSIATLPVPGTPGSGAPKGLYVIAVAAGGPAATAGLLPADVITEVEGKPATDPTQLAKKPGETVKLTYERAGTAAEATITLAAAP